MSKVRKKKTKGNASKGKDDSDNDVLQDMPLATAILNNDTTAVGSIIAKSLPNPDNVTIENVSIAKSAGEAFTGGRSTPVYHVCCSLTRLGGTRRQRHFVVKLVLMPFTEEEKGLPHAIWQKRESYAVERRFYDCAAPRIRLHPLTIPKLLYSDRDGSRPWPAVCFFMNNLQDRFPDHPDFLSVSQAKRALQWLATFHALFWGELPQKKLWSRGGFWTPKKSQTNNGIKLKTNDLAQQWTQTARWLENKYPELCTPSTRGLGNRLEAAAGPISDFLSLQSSCKIGTLNHGDFKAANMFLAAESAAGEDLGAESVAVLDFQFTGCGVGAEDVAYLLYPDARGDFFAAETELMECYHEELISQLIQQQKGGPSSLSFETLQFYYELSRLDQTRYLLTKGWVGSTEGDAKLVGALEATLSRIDGGHVLANEMEYKQALAKWNTVQQL